MNRTITANIAGIVFHIDENAYEVLKRYLDTLRNHFTQAEERDEIIADIESRLAELFKEKMADHTTIISLSMVEEAIKLMGNPDEIEAEENKEDVKNESSVKSKKRIYRNPDDKVLGGVCSGLSAYFNIDPIWFRLIFLFLFISWGTGLFFYIVLWLIVPEAKTTAEKLEMKGESVNISNIEKSVKEEFNSVKNRFGEFSDELKNGNASDKLRYFIQKFVNLIIQILTLVFKVFVKFIAAIMVIVGMAVFIALLIVFLGMMGVLQMTLPVVLTSITDSSLQFTFASIGVFLFVGIPFLMLLYKGLNILLGNRIKSKIPKYVMSILWFTGFILVAASTGMILNNFGSYSSVNEKSTIIPFKSNTLYLNVDNSRSTDEENEDENAIVLNTIAYQNGKLWKRIQLNIVKSTSDEMEMVKIQSAYGKNKSMADKSARNINYSYAQTDSLLKLNTVFSLPEDAKFRNQKLKLLLKLPEGKSVYIENGVEKILLNVDNTEDYDAEQMPGHTWEMTKNGLKCMDCDSENLSL